MPIIPIAASVVGGAIAAKGAKNAAQTQANAADRAAALQLQAQQETNWLQQNMFNQQRMDTKDYLDQARKDQEPWRRGGANALSELMLRLGLEGRLGPNPINGMPNEGVTFDNSGNIITDGRRGYDPAFGTLNNQYRLRDFTAADFQKDPGYDFRLNQGREAIEGSAAARGMQLSGATLKALNRYGQDFASNEYSNAYNRFNQDQERRYNAFEQNKTGMFNRLSSLAGTGQVATNQLNSIGNQALNANANAAQNYSNNVGNVNMTTANNVGSNIRSAGDARASGYLGRGNAWGGALSNIYGNYTTNNLMERLFQNRAPVETRTWGV